MPLSPVEAQAQSPSARTTPAIPEATRFTIPPLRPSGRRRFCSDACRQAAWRARQPVVPVAPIPPRSPRPLTVYECPACEARFLGEQRCPDCHLFCRRVGPGGACPHCDERIDVFGSGETKLPFYMLVFAPPHRPPANGYVGNARIFESSSARAYFAFGIATEPGDVPVSGTMTCSFAEDEIGEGALTFDRAAGTVSGWAEPFWGGGVRYELVQTSFAPGATTFAGTFGTIGLLDGRFFGPRAVNVAVRAKGGGQGFAAVSGIMTGVCKG